MGQGIDLSKARHRERYVTLQRCSIIHSVIVSSRLDEVLLLRRYDAQLLP